MKVRKAVFPVAGLGTRFLPATKAIPKEMLPVVDKPLIQYAVEEALASGIEKIVFVTHLPCAACAKRLVNLGNVKTVYYSEDYRKRDALDILKACHIEVIRLQRGEQ